MKPYSRSVLVVVTLIMISGCAHPPKAPSDVSASQAQNGDIVVPPKMLFSKTQLTLHTRGGRPHGTIEVPVSPGGDPDVFGIRYIGIFDDLTRRDLNEWISQTTFTPSKRNGVPVAGVFKMAFQ